MNKTLIAVLAFGAFTTACGSDVAPDRGEVVVAYDFDDKALLERASVYLVRGDANSRCGDQPFLNVSSIASELRVDLPLTGEVTFNSLDEGDFWMAWVTGSTSAGTPVAFDCQDFIRVREGEETRTTLIGRTRPLDISGVYESDMTFDFELPTQALGILQAANVLGCSIFNLQTELCDVIDALNTTLSDLDVTAQWQLSQQNDAVNGRLFWTEVEGVSVKQGFNLATGGFRARIAGTTSLQIVSEDLKVNMDEVLEFVIVEVMDSDLDQDLVEAIADATDTFTTDLSLVAGDASVVDFDFDWVADSFNGTFDMSIELPQLEQARDLEVRWSAERMRTADSSN
ncbi:MAG: hypothetical protein AAF658_05830 [Myxococcota bacterium]